ncbi:MAG: hypothetical protein QM768_12940 [Agriterribacter sp.]
MAIVLRSLKYLLAETGNKIFQIRNREFSNNIIEDLLLKDYAAYFEATINAIKQNILPENNAIVEDEFQKLSLIDISVILKQRPFNIFSIFNDHLEGGNEVSRMNYNDKILATLLSIESHCKNLIYFLEM